MSELRLFSPPLVSGQTKPERVGLGLATHFGQSNRRFGAGTGLTIPEKKVSIIMGWDKKYVQKDMFYNIRAKTIFYNLCL